MNSNNTSKEGSAAYRRKYIKDSLKKASQPLTATYFAKELCVSRQIIVSDVAILRASGMDILATPKGYITGSSDLFIKKVESEKNAAPISSLTDGAHLHRIGCRDKATFSLIKEALRDKGILIS